MSAGTPKVEANPGRSGLPYHELCEKFFSPIEGTQFNELVADIKANGLRDKIVLHERKILDGRNRYRACIKAGLFKPSADPKVHIKDTTHFEVLPANQDPAQLTRFFAAGGVRSTDTSVALASSVTEGAPCP